MQLEILRINVAQGDLDKSTLRKYSHPMNIIRRTLDIDADTDAGLREMADDRGQVVAADSRKQWRCSIPWSISQAPISQKTAGGSTRSKQTRAAMPQDDVKNWVAS